MRHAFIFATVLLLVALVASQVSLYNKVPFTHPGFLTVTKSAVDDTKSLFISTFQPFGADTAYMQPNINLMQKDKPFAFHPTALSTKDSTGYPFHWPNQICFYPPIQDYAKFGGIVVPTGFLVPGKGQGGLFIYKFTNANRTQLGDTPNQIAKDGGWFYHRTIAAMDLTGPGSINLVTCRAQKPLLGGWKVQLLILTLDVKTGTWKNYVIAESGCDVFFQVQDIDNDGKLEIVAASFFTSQLTLFWSEDPHNNYLNSVKSRVIDTSAGALFDVVLADLDGDGALEALVTNHEKAKDKVHASLFAYKIPAQPKVQNWTRYLISDKFEDASSLIVPNQAPGSPIVFWPTQNTTGRPWIALAGDGAYRAYVFQPTPALDLTYKVVFNESLDGTVGGIAVDDINNDGFAEILIPAYDAGYISVYTLKN